MEENSDLEISDGKKLINIEFSLLEDLLSLNYVLGHLRAIMDTLTCVKSATMLFIIVGVEINGAKLESVLA